MFQLVVFPGDTRRMTMFVKNWMRLLFLLALENKMLLIVIFLWLVGFSAVANFAFFPGLANPVTEDGCYTLSKHLSYQFTNRKLINSLFDVYFSLFFRHPVLCIQWEAIFYVIYYCYWLLVRHRNMVIAIVTSNNAVLEEFVTWFSSLGKEPGFDSWSCSFERQLNRVNNWMF